tara:strand:+ start:1652 stop:2014 length:363 start_codon:yes stop_codon:yes gene_type:complete
MRTILIFLLLLSFSSLAQQVINEEEFEEKLNDDIVLIEFYAEWNKDNCVDLAEFKDIKSYMVNIETCPNLTSTYKILSVPTILIFYNKEVVERYDADLTFQLCIKAPKKKVEELVLKKFM